jgi:hypothetical protein
MIPHVRAITFLRPMSSGRTKPCLMVCEDDDGDQEEIVVKLRSGIETREMGSTSEVLASLLARDLDLPVPEPRLVEIEPGFERAVPNPEIAERVRDSVGWSFGSVRLASGVTTWPKGKSIPQLLRQRALEVFAFDTIIQNPDRRKGNPNVLWKGDELFIYDHELSLTFFLPQLGWQPPWTGQGLEFLTDHVFYDELKGTPVNLDRLTGAFEAITEERFDEYVAAVPDDWKVRSDAAVQIVTYLKQARENLDGITSAIGRLLR